MYSYTWDIETGGILLNTTPAQFSKEPRPVYYQELDILGFDKYWDYAKDDTAPYMWAEANNYYYRGHLVAQIKGGTYFTPPQIIMIDSPTKKGQFLKLVDIPLMIKKNQEIFNSLVSETIKKIYNTYKEFKDKVDIFHVSFSGGKDSEVALDLVQRALPHNEFVVIFGDTGMEFPDTYKQVKETAQKCLINNITFLIAKSELNPLDSWRKFGPPAASLRWCCSVHKTTPQLLCLKKYLGKDSFTEMAYVGVRADESVRRSGYSYISYGTKHKGQYSCNPILNWSSFEVWLYIYANNLPINMGYKRGNTRVGCLICPMSTGKNDFLNHLIYKDQTQPLLDVIFQLNASYKNNPDQLLSYVENNGWRARKNGRDLTISPKDYKEIREGAILKITFRDKDKSWMQWIKTIGKTIIDSEKQSVSLEFKAKKYTLKYSIQEDDFWTLSYITSNSPDALLLQKKIRHVCRKSHYCVACQVCEANCKYGNLHFIDHKPLISDTCVHCGECLDIKDGCYVYKSLWLSSNTGTMNKQSSLDRYAAHGPKIEWFKEFLKYGEDFKEKHSLGNMQIPMFLKFLRDAGVLGKKDQLTIIADLLKKSSMNEPYVWALMLINLSMTSEVGWFIQNVNIDEPITQASISGLLSNLEVSNSGIKAIPAALKRISLLPFSAVGFGSHMKGNSANGGAIFTRTRWENPDPRVVLYGLFKFAEACDNYYQFTLTDLLNDSIERDGISPTRLFGIGREEMVNILNSLAINYPDFISATFTLDLDSISLRNDKTSEDVLELF